MPADELSYDAARLSCEDLGGRLAEARNLEQFEIISEFNETSSRFWLGGRFDIAVQNEWLWNSDGSAIDLTQFFNVNEPNNARGDEYCLEFIGRGLNDHPCDFVLRYLCEFAGIGDVPLCLD